MNEPANNIYVCIDGWMDGCMNMVYYKYTCRYLNFEIGILNFNGIFPGKVCINKAQRMWQTLDLISFAFSQHAAHNSNTHTLQWNKWMLSSLMVFKRFCHQLNSFTHSVLPWSIQDVRTYREHRHKAIKNGYAINSAKCRKFLQKRASNHQRRQKEVREIWQMTKRERPEEKCKWMKHFYSSPARWGCVRYIKATFWWVAIQNITSEGPLSWIRCMLSGNRAAWRLLAFLQLNYSSLQSWRVMHFTRENFRSRIKRLRVWTNADLQMSSLITF